MRYALTWICERRQLKALSVIRLARDSRTKSWRSGCCTSVSLLCAPRVAGVPEANRQQPPSRRCLRIIAGRGTGAKWPNC